MNCRISRKVRCKKDRMPKSIAIVAIARKENPYINTWIQYHRKLGIDHVYVYDNSHGDEERLKISRENSDYTTVIPAYDETCIQKRVYTSGYYDFGKFHDYLLFIDIDEFLTLMKHDNVSDYVEYLEKVCPGFHVARLHWEIYDDNDAVTRDTSIPVYQFFTRLASTERGLENQTVTKSLVKTKLPGITFRSCHFPSSDSMELINCNGNGEFINPDNQWIEPRAVEFAKLRHYVTKTISEFMEHSTLNADTGSVYDINTKFYKYNRKTPEKEAYYR